MVDGFVWEQVLDGIQDAFARVCHATWKDLYAYAYRQVHNHPEAEVVVQEVYARLRRLAPRLRGRSGEVEAILLAMTDDVVAHGWRGGETRVTGDGPDIPRLVERGRALVAEHGAEAEARRRQAVRAALARLPQDQNILVTSRVQEGVSLSEAARRAGRAESEARALVCDGLAALARELGLRGVPSAAPPRAAQAAQALDRYISDLNRDSTPDAHRRRAADPQGLYAAVRAVRSLREFAGARRSFPRRLLARLGTPVAATRLAATAGKVIAAAVAGLVLVLVVNLLTEPLRRYETDRSMYPAMVEGQTVTITVTGRDGALTAPGALSATWRATMPFSYAPEFSPRSWYAVDPASGSVVVRDLARAREAKLTAVTVQGDLVELAEATGHPTAFAHNAAGYAYAAWIARESGGANRRPYLDITWLTPEGERVWRLYRVRTDLGHAPLPARLSLDPGGGGLLFSGLVPPGPGVNDQAGSLILRVDSAGELQAAAPLGLQPWAVDWARRRILVAEQVGGRARLSLLGLETLELLATGEVDGRPEGDPVVDSTSGDWWLAAVPNVYRIGPDLTPSFSRAGLVKNSAVGFAPSPSGWCAAWTDMELSLVGPQGQVAWTRDLTGEGSGRPVAAAVSADGSLALVVKESDQAPAAGASRMLLLELVDWHGTTLWSEVVEDHWVTPPVATFAGSRQAVALWGNGQGRLIESDSGTAVARAFVLSDGMAYGKAILMGDGRYLLLESKDYNRIACYDLSLLLTEN